MKKSLIVIALVLGLIYSIGGIYFYFFDKNNTNKITNISSIKGYNYILKSNATQLMKEEFNLLKNNLESEKINEEEYALSIAKLFIIDIYTLDNKINKYDIGGVDYVMPLGIESLKLNITDTLYKYIEDNTNNKRKQELPEVKSILVEETEITEMKIDEEVYEAYKINLSWDYVKDLEYDKFGEVIVVKDNNKYFVAEKK